MMNISILGHARNERHTAVPGRIPVTSRVFAQLISLVSHYKEVIGEGKCVVVGDEARL